jgi:hypothetical protein
MTDIKSRLVDGMRGQGIRLPDGDWLRLDDNNLELIAERLQRTPSVAIVGSNELVALHDLGTDIHSAIEQIWDRKEQQ